MAIQVILYSDGIKLLDYLKMVDVTSHIWEHRVLLVVLTTPGSSRLAACLKSCRESGFPEPYVFMGITASSQMSKMAAISQGHHRIFQFFRDVAPKTCHLMVLEDDCRFLTTQASEKLREQLDYLEGQKWSTLHVGHCPLGPIFPVRPGLVNTTFPWTAHCYVVNGIRLRKWLLEVSPDKWRRPHTLEGWLIVPPNEKYALSPELATQSVLPKEIQKIPILNGYPLAMWCQAMDSVMLMGPYVIGIILVCITLIIFYEYLRQ